MRYFQLLILIAALTMVSALSNEDHALTDHASSGDDSVFLDPFEHLHFTKLGTPIIHSFGVEPAFTGRDLFIDYRYRSGDKLDGHEVELELEWAFTSRIGILIEAPYIFENEEGEGSIEGFGDLAIVPRAMLVKHDRFLLTTQIEVVSPTGSNDLGGETSIAPGIATWFDLGNWWTLNSQLAVEHFFDEDVDEFVFGFGLVKSFGIHPNLSAKDPHDHESATGLFNLHFEVTGSIGLNGEEEGTLNAEGLFGFSYGINRHMDFRLGYEFPLSSPRDFDSGVVTGLIWHF